jgi:L-cysteine:1D-myo-inositol 2-amino-2-deoxy-alpha-D-glucopyranoside ligase
MTAALAGAGPPVAARLPASALGYALAMRTWPDPELPAVPGEGVAPRLYDTASRAVRPIDAGQTARLYVCGITPYDATHLGHAATYLAFDLVQRVWRDAGHDVHYVQNVTDVDDPLLERANATGQDWRELAARETALFAADMAALRMLPPADYVSAVEAIPLVVELIERLRTRGAAYQVGPDVYFDVHADPAFGQVSGYDEATMRRLFAQRGGDPERPGKRDPLDCLLWQGARPGEPAWDSSLGSGRPGWHIECAAIALKYLGIGFDVQGGGSDLIFPHHEMSAGEAQVATGCAPFARHYAHAGMLALDGEKMSKSRGNLVFVSKLRQAGVDPMAIRLALLAHHYRSDWEWTQADLDAAEARLARWRRAAAAPAAGDARALAAGVRADLANDLDAPAALARLDAFAEAALAGGADPSGPAVMGALSDALLGVRL